MYRLERVLKHDVKSYRCSQKTCKGRVHVTDDDIKHILKHAHVSNPVKTEIRMAMANVRHRAETSRDMPRFVIQLKQDAL